ncbi:MAG TPA: cytochrome c [Bryobacterales bacterium]|nr:cytochrome c [Bryobacterales bacterium]
MKRRPRPLVCAMMLLAFLPACARKPVAVKSNALLEAYAVEQDPNDAQHPIPLNYQQTQGARVFRNNCVWCHADSTPAGPSNRSNVSPTPPLASDGATLNSLSDDFLQNVITLGGSAMGKSTMMPPWGRTLSHDEIQAVIAYIRAIAQPPYQPPARPGGQYPAR